MKEKSKRAPMKYQSISQNDLPQGRNGKHKSIVRELLGDIERLKPGNALKIPIADLPDKKENVRSALSRVTRQRGLLVSTSSDAEYFYIWVPPVGSK